MKKVTISMIALIGIVGVVGVADATTIASTDYVQNRKYASEEVYEQAKSAATDKQVFETEAVPTVEHARAIANVAAGANVARPSSNVGLAAISSAGVVSSATKASVAGTLGTATADAGTNKVLTKITRSNSDGSFSAAGTMDVSGTPASGGAALFTTGGAYTELAKKVSNPSSAIKVAAVSTTGAVSEATSVNVTALVSGLDISKITASTTDGQIIRTVKDTTTGKTSLQYENPATSVTSGGTGLLTSGAAYNALSGKVTNPSSAIKVAAVSAAGAVTEATKASVAGTLGTATADAGTNKVLTKVTRSSSDGSFSAAGTMGVSGTPASGGADLFTTGGAYTELAKKVSNPGSAIKVAAVSTTGVVSEATSASVTGLVSGLDGSKLKDASVSGSKLVDGSVGSEKLAIVGWDGSAFKAKSVADGDVFIGLGDGTVISKGCDDGAVLMKDSQNSKDGWLCVKVDTGKSK